MNEDNEKKILTSTYSFELITKKPLNIEYIDISNWLDKDGEEYSILKSLQNSYLSKGPSDYLFGPFKIIFFGWHDICEDEGKMNYTAEIIQALLQFQYHFKCELEGHFDWFHRADFFEPEEIDLNYDNGKYVAPDFKRMDIKNNPMTENLEPFWLKK